MCAQFADRIEDSVEIDHEGSTFQDFYFDQVWKSIFNVLQIYECDRVMTLHTIQELELQGACLTSCETRMSCVCVVAVIRDEMPDRDFLVEGCG